MKKNKKLHIILTLVLCFGMIFGNGFSHVYAEDVDTEPVITEQSEIQESAEETTIVEETTEEAEKEETVVEETVEKEIEIKEETTIENAVSEENIEVIETYKDNDKAISVVSALENELNDRELIIYGYDFGSLYDRSIDFRFSVNDASTNLNLSDFLNKEITFATLSEKASVNTFKNATQTVTNPNDQKKWTCVGFVPITDLGFYHDYEIYDKYVFDNENSAKEYINNNDGILYGDTTTEELLIKWGQVQNMNSVTKNATNLICVWYTKDASLKSMPHHEKGNLNPTIPTVNAVNYFGNSQGVTVNITKAEFIAKTVFEYDYEIIIDESAPDLVNIDLTDITDSPEIDWQTGLQPGDRVVIKFHIIDKSGHNYEYVTGSGKVGTTPLVGEGTSRGTGFEGYDLIESEVNGYPCSNIPHRIRNVALVELLATIRETKASDELIGKALFFQGYGATLRENMWGAYNVGLDEFTDPEFERIEEEYGNIDDMIFWGDAPSKEGCRYLTQNYLDDYYIDYLRMITDIDAYEFSEFGSAIALLLAGEHSTECPETNPNMAAAVYYSFFAEGFKFGPAYYDLDMSNYLREWADNPDFRSIYDWMASETGLNTKETFDTVLAQNWKDGWSANVDKNGVVTHDAQFGALIEGEINDNATQCFQAEIGFTFQLKRGSVQEPELGNLKITKTFTGDNLTDAQKAEATFTVTGPNDFNETFTYKDMENGVKEFKDIALGEYTVTESNARVRGYSLTVTGEGTQTLTSDKDIEFNIVNEYHRGETVVQLSGTKVLTGRALNDGEFTFEVLENDQVISTAKNNAEGLITFDEIKYTEEGTHLYTIREVKGNDTTITYDSTVFTVNVDVTDTGNGTLSATVNYTNGNIEFVNTYTSNKTASLVIFKVDHNLAFLDGAQFRMVKDDGTIFNPTPVDTVVNARFEFTGLTDGFYTVEEYVTPAGYQGIDSFEVEVRDGTVYYAGEAYDSLTVMNSSDDTITPDVLGAMYEDTDYDNWLVEVQGDEIVRREDVQGKGVQTGDDSHVIGYAVALGVSFIGGLYLFTTRKKKENI